MDRRGVESCVHDLGAEETLNFRWLWISGEFLLFPVNETIHSTVFGTLRRDWELRDQTTYTTEVTIPNHGRATVSITALPGYQPEWGSLLHEAENSYPMLLQHEATLRHQAGSKLQSLHRDYWGKVWCSIPDHELVSILRLHHLNFFSDDTIELWYCGGTPFEEHDVLITLNANMHITEVELEG